MRKIFEIILHIFLWLSGYVLLLYGANTVGVFNKSDGSVFAPVTIGTIINVIVFYWIALSLIPKFSLHKKAQKLIIQVLFLFLISSAVESLIGYSLFTSWYSSLDEPFGSQLIINSVSNFLILSLAVSYGFAKNWISNERLKQKLKEEKLSAELDFLKAQINPHFLFNVLNMAYSSASKSKDEMTANIIEKLSGLMRYMLYESNSEKVSLDKEVAYIEDFITLQNLRLSNETPVSVDFKTKGNLSKQIIAPLILVPFVENAFKHGIKLDTESLIQIRIEVLDEEIIFNSENQILKPNSSIKSPHSGIGLDNVKKRLALIYPNMHKLSISTDSDRFVVNLKITNKQNS